MTTYCRDCSYVHTDTRKQEPWQWRCVRVPVEPGFGFVDPDHAPNPPYAKCSSVNVNGECPMFEAVRVLEKVDG